MSCNAPPAETDIVKLYECGREAMSAFNASNYVTAFDLATHVVRGLVKFLPKKKNDDRLVGAPSIGALRALTDNELAERYYAETDAAADGTVSAGGAGAWIAFMLLRIVVTRMFDKIDGLRE